MQEEVNEKTISLCIKGGKITAQILKAALIKLLAEMDKKKKQQEKGKGQCKRTGKQSIKSLQRSGAQITNIVVTDNNIKSFDRVARKYGIDYSLKKVEQEGLLYNPYTYSILKGVFGNHFFKFSQEKNLPQGFLSPHGSFSILCISATDAVKPLFDSLCHILM